MSVERFSGPARMTAALLLLILLLGCTAPCTPQNSGIVEHEDGSVTSSQRVCG